MCCIFTCFGWMIDLIQRFWTFLMSCCISSAVCCLLVVSSMAGIALGYNYSLAEYIDLRESNVSIFLKRGIFDDEIADLQLRRANDEMQKKGMMRTGADDKTFDEESTVRSGRRLDDSVFDGGDQFKYEGSLMKLTAKPPFEHTTSHLITEDSELGSAIGSYKKDTLDSLKAIQSIVDARRAYAQTIRGPTLSPVPTYPFNEVERVSQSAEMGPIDQQLPSVRRMMSGSGNPTMNPARLAVPDRSLGQDVNWVGPLRPIPYEKKFKDLGMEATPLTFPSPIPYKGGPIRPTPTMSTRGEGSLYLTQYHPITLFSTRPTEENELLPYTKDPKALSFKEKLMEENNRPIKKHKPSDDDYDYDVKGLPVRKRRSINYNQLTTNSEPYDIPYKDKELDGDAKSNKTNILTDLPPIHEFYILFDTDKIRNQKLKILLNPIKQNNISKPHMEGTNGTIKENVTFDLEPTNNLLDKQNLKSSTFQNFSAHSETKLLNIKEDLAKSFRRYHSVSSGNIIEHDPQIREALCKNRTVSIKISANLKSTVNVTLATNKTQNAMRNFNITDGVTIQPLLIKFVLPTVA